jgi:hypothetical protein
MVEKLVVFLHQAHFTGKSCSGLTSIFTISLDLLWFLPLLIATPIPKVLT